MPIMPMIIIVINKKRTYDEIQKNHQEKRQDLNLNEWYEWSSLVWLKKCHSFVESYNAGQMLKVLVAREQHF